MSGPLRTLAAAAAALVLVVGCSGDDAADAGVEYTSPDGDFTVTFPEEPSRDTLPIPLPDGTSVDSDLLYHESGDYALLMSWTDYPADFDMSDTSVALQGARDGAVENVGGTLDESTPVTRGGRPGVEFSASADAGEVGAAMNAVLFLDGQRLYQVLAVGDQATDFAAEAERFLDSFQFTQEAG